MDIDYQMARDVSYRSATSIFKTMADGKNIRAEPISEQALNQSVGWKDGYKTPGRGFNSWREVVNAYHGDSAFIPKKYHYDVALWQNSTLMGLSAGYVIVQNKQVRLEIVETIPVGFAQKNDISRPKRFFEFISVAYHAFASAAQCKVVSIVDPAKELIPYYKSFGYAPGRSGFLYRDVK